MELAMGIMVCAILGACLVAGLIKELAAYSPAKFGGLFKF